MIRVLTAFFLCLGLAATAWSADTPPSSVGPNMTGAAQAFVKSLKPEQSAKALMKFDDPARLDWHNIPKPTRKGLQVREMSADQQKLCHNLLRAALSESGYEKAVRIMSLEANLYEVRRTSRAHRCVIRSATSSPSSDSPMTREPGAGALKDITCR